MPPADGRPTSVGHQSASWHIIVDIFVGDFKSCYFFRDEVRKSSIAWSGDRPTPDLAPGEWTLTFGKALANHIIVMITDGIL